MSLADLNNNLDFARSTFSQTSALLSVFLPNKNQWIVQEGSYNGIKFHIFESESPYQASVPQVQDAGGRRKAKYMYPYLDGQTTDDLGRKPDQFNINIVFHGANYLTGFKRLFTELNKPVPGTLVHPIRGVTQCGMEDYTILHQSTERNAMMINLTMIEHNFSTPNIENITEDRSFKSGISKAIEFFSNIQSAIVRIQGAIQFGQNVKNLLLNNLLNLKSSYALLLSRLNKTFNGRPTGEVRAVSSLNSFSATQTPTKNSGEATLNYNDIPLLLPVNEGGLLNKDGTFQSTTAAQAMSPSDPFINVPIDAFSEQTNLALAVDVLEKEVNALRISIDQTISLITKIPVNFMLGAGSGITTEPNFVGAQPNIPGALEFNQEIIDLKAIAVIIQDIFERGKASSRAQIINYTTPRLMSVREVCFANGISVNRAIEIELLNTDLSSVNYIDAGTVLRVPI